MAILGANVTFQSVGPSGTPDIAYSNGFFIVQSPWGQDNVVIPCASFADFTRNFGGLNKVGTINAGTTADTYTAETDDDVVQGYYNVKGYFDEKGANSPGIAWVVRVVATSSGPTAASKTFPDSAGTNNTTIASKSKGSPGGTTQITVINPSPRVGVLTIGAGTVSVTSGAAAVTGVGTAFQTGGAWVGFGIRIGTEYYTILSVASATALTLASNAVSTWTTSAYAVGNGTTAAYIRAYMPQSGVFEEWDLEPTAQSASDISRKSQLINVTLPAGLQLPVSAVASKLTTGTPATADSYNATAGDIVGTTSSAGAKTGLQAFNDVKYGTGIVAVPGQVNATVRTGLKTHCETYFRAGIAGPSAGLTLLTSQSEYAVSSNLVGGWVPRLWVKNDNSSQGSTVMVDNGGHLAGLCARMDRDYGGPHKSPAGRLHPFASVIDVESQGSGTELYDDAGSAFLADFNVNTIRRLPQGGIYSNGLRSFASDGRYRQWQVGRIVCFVYHACFNIVSRYTFEPIDRKGVLFGKIKSDLDAFFFQLYQPGTILGTIPGKEPKKGDAWFTVCNNGNNPDSFIGQGIVRADLSFVPTLNAERIDLAIQVAAPGFGSAAASSQS